MPILKIPAVLKSKLPNFGPNMTIPVYITTRLGLAIHDPAYYEYRIPLMGMTTARSLANQSDQQFVWAIAIDQFAPDWCENKIVDAIGSVPAIIWRRNPIQTGFCPVNKKAILESIGDQPVIVAGLDADDLVSRSFVADIRQALGRQPPGSAVSFASGINLYNDRWLPDYLPWLGVAFGTISNSSVIRSPYSVRHYDLCKKVIAWGGNPIVVQGPPMWVRTWHSRSVSSATLGIRYRSDVRGGQFSPQDFGVSAAEITAIQRYLGEPLEAQAEPKFAERNFGRLEMKIVIYEQIRELKNRITVSTSSKEKKSLKRKVAILAQTLYAI